MVGTEECCSIKIRHNDGWYSVYIHLNNDMYLTDDGLGIGVRPDLKVGDEVLAGEVIGWIGDSGNAEDSVNHLHFELRTRQGLAVDPAASLRRARREADLPDDPVAGPYLDDDSHGVQLQAAATADRRACSFPVTTSGSTSARMSSLTPSSSDRSPGTSSGSSRRRIEGRTQEVPQVFEAAAADSRTLGELMGCEEGEPCLAFGVDETAVAQMAAWALGQPKPADLSNPELVLEVGALGILPEAAEAEVTLRNAGVVGECRPPLDGERLVTRQEALTSLVRWVLGPTIADCADVSQPVR